MIVLVLFLSHMNVVIIEDGNVWEYESYDACSMAMKEPLTKGTMFRPFHCNPSFHEVTK